MAVERCDGRHNSVRNQAVAARRSREWIGQSKAAICDDRHWRCQQLGISRTQDKSIPQECFQWREP